MGLLHIHSPWIANKLNIAYGMQGHSPHTQKHSIRKVLLFAANIEQFYFYTVNHWSSINFFATVGNTTAIKSTTQNKHTQEFRVADLPSG